MKHPGRLEITTKIGCICNCVYCPQSLLISRYFNRKNNPSPDKIMSLDTFKRCVNKLPKGTRIDFSGMAEPWLNPECTKMVLYAHEQGFPIAVYSTLLGMKEDDFDLIKNIPFEEFVLHVPDDKRNTHMDITNEYLMLLQKVLLYKSATGPIVSGISCHAGIHPEIKKFIPTNLKLITELHDRAGNIGSEYVESKTNKGSIICINCGRDMHHNVLLPDGTVLLCCMDYGMKHVMGNLLSQSYEEIHQSCEFKKICKGLEDESINILCRNCVNAKSIDEVYEEYFLYMSWARNLLNENFQKVEELNKYKIWVDSLKECNKELEEEQKSLQVQYEDRLKELREYKMWVENLQRKNEHLEEEQKNLQVQYEGRLKELNEYQDWVKNLQGKNEELEQEQRNIERQYEDRLKELSEYCNWVGNLKKSNEELKENYIKLEGQYQERIKEQHEYQDWVKNLQKQNKQIIEQKENLERSNLEEQCNLCEMEKKYFQLERELNNLKKSPFYKLTYNTKGGDK